MQREKESKKLHDKIDYIQLNLSEIQGDIKVIKQQFIALNGTVATNKKAIEELQNKTEGISLVRILVYGFVGMILVAFFGSLIALVVRMTP